MNKYFRQNNMLRNSITRVEMKRKKTNQNLRTFYQPGADRKMDETEQRLPATISAGMAQKVRDAFSQTVDGHPASQGMPMEAEVKHYYNYFLIHEEIGFDTFMETLALDLSRSFPGLNFNMAWVRQCDALSNVRGARRSVAKLRAYVHEQRYFSVSFWDILWTLQEVSMNALGVTHDEAGTTPREVDALAWQFVLRESRPHVQNLRRQLTYPETTSARNAFHLVDSLLSGVPIPKSMLCRNRATHYSPGGPYKTYCAIASGRPIAPDSIGWSRAEHRAARKLIFPEQQDYEDPRIDRLGPSAPATQGQPVFAAPDQQPAMLPFVSAGESDRRQFVDPETWSKVVELAMRNLPQLSQTAIHPS